MRTKVKKRNSYTIKLLQNDVRFVVLNIHKGKSLPHNKYKPFNEFY